MLRTFFNEKSCEILFRLISLSVRDWKKGKGKNHSPSSSDYGSTEKVMLFWWRGGGRSANAFEGQGYARNGWMNGCVAQLVFHRRIGLGTSASILTRIIGVYLRRRDTRNPSSVFASRLDLSQLFFSVTCGITPSVRLQVMNSTCLFNQSCKKRYPLGYNSLSSPARRE